MGIKEEQRGNKTVYIVTASKRNKAGKRYQCKRLAPNKAVARTLERQLYAAIEEEIKGRPTIEWHHFLGIYHEELKKRKAKLESTINNEVSILRKHTWDRWYGRSIREISSQEVRDLIAEAYPNGALGSMRALSGYIRGAFKVAIEMGFANDNPASTVSYKTPYVPRRAPSMETVRKIITLAKEQGFEYYPLYHFLALTGCRSGEAFAVTFEDVDFEHDIICIRRNWTRNGGFREANKNGSIRTVPMNAELKTLLLSLKEKATGPKDFVLPRIRSWAQNEASKWLQAFISGMGIAEKMTLHAFRGVFVTAMLRNGRPLPEVMRIVSHKRMETTMRYLYLAGLDVTGATDNLSFLLPNPTPSPDAQAPVSKPGQLVK